MRTLTLAIALFATAVFAAPPQNPDEMLGAAKVAIHQNDGERAAELLEKAIAARPNSAELHYRLSQAYAEIADGAGPFKGMSMARKVLAALKRAVELDPNYMEARYDLASFYAMAPGLVGGNEEKALQQAAEVKRRDSFQGHRVYGRVYTAQKKLDLARAEYVNAVREELNSARAHTALATFLSSQDRNHRSAFDEIEKAIQLDPGYMPAWYRLGDVAVRSGSNYARGEEGLKKYLAYEPKDGEPQLADAHYQLGQIYEKQGRKADARQSYETSLRLRPNKKSVQGALKRVS